jgi:hypothetical protein
VGITDLRKQDWYTETRIYDMTFYSFAFLFMSLMPPLLHTLKRKWSVISCDTCFSIHSLHRG